VAQHVAFETGGFRGGYPGSLMGVMAVIRQGFEDAKRHEIWQARYDADPKGMKRPDTLTAYAPLARAASAKIPVVFDATTPANVLRALSLAKEFNLDAMVVGSGADDEVLAGIKAAGRPVIVSMAFPDKPEIDDAAEALDTSHETLRRYVAARADAGRLAAAGIPIAIGTCRMKNVSEFPDHLRKAIAAGLTEDAALAALTVNPAKLYGVDRAMGTIEAGKAADVVVEDGPLFGEKTKPSRVYVDGVEYAIEQKKLKGDPNAKVDPRGTWSVTVSFGSVTVVRTWMITGKEGAYEGTAETREGTVTFKSMTRVGNELKIEQPSSRGNGLVNIDIVITGESFEGEGESASGPSFTLKGNRTSGPNGGAL